MRRSASASDLSVGCYALDIGTAVDLLEGVVTARVVSGRDDATGLVGELLRRAGVASRQADVVVGDGLRQRYSNGDLSRSATLGALAVLHCVEVGERRGTGCVEILAEAARVAAALLDVVPDAVVRAALPCQGDGVSSTGRSLPSALSASRRPAREVTPSVGNSW